MTTGEINNKMGRQSDGRYTKKIREREEKFL